MIFTARQIEDLHKTNGHVRLPVGARLTPLANDWVRSRKIAVAYGTLDDSSPSPGTPGEGRGDGLRLASPGAVLWWCDGPCGQAKAAIAAQAREINLQPMSVTAEPRYLVGAIKHLAGEIKSDRAVAGILLVHSGAAAVVFANRCPSLRAILGTCRESVQQGVDLVGANALVIEHPYQTLQQVRNLLWLFVRMRREMSDDVKRKLQELSTCG